MIYIEDIIAMLLQCRLNIFDQNIISSFMDQQWKGQAFTEKQANLALRIIARYRAQLSGIDIDAILANPQFKQPFRVKTVAYRISIGPDQLGIKTCIRCQFPYDKDIVEKIKKNRDIDAEWNSGDNSWYFSLTETNVLFVDNLFTDKNYDSDERFRDILKQCQSIINDMDQYVPMLDVNDNLPVYVNAPRYLPVLKSQDLMSALFEARLKGISVFSDKVYDYINSEQVSETTRRLLTQPINETLFVDSTRTRFDEVCDIITRLTPCLAILSTSGEIENLSMLHCHLSAKGISNDDISVMFRLPSSRNDFNLYVKENHLNHRLSENTKVVVVQSKIPKPLMSAGFRFNTVLNLSKVSAHYTLRNHLKLSYNIINYGLHPDTKSQKYAYL